MHPGHPHKLVFICAADKRYDLDFKTPNNSGAEVKSGMEMIEMYKMFCKGKMWMTYVFNVATS